MTNKIRQVYERESVRCCGALCRSYRDKTGKNLSLYESLRALVPICLQFVLFLLWAHNSSYNILNRQPRLFYLAAGTIFSNITVSVDCGSMALLL